MVDALIERNHRILGLEAASPRDVSNLRNWVDGNACLARQETAYLTRDEDLLTVAPSRDRSVMNVEAWVEDCLIRFFRWCHQVWNLLRERNRLTLMRQ